MNKGYRLSSRYTLVDGGAVLLQEDGTIVVADLHLGCEAALEEQGLSIPRVQTGRIREYVGQLLDTFAPSRLIVAGDLKHNFSRNLAQEWNDVVRFIEGIGSAVRLEVVKGNHDNFLVSILREHGVPFVRESEASGARIVHGHDGSFDGRPTVMGHIHPSIAVRDSVRASAKSACFLYDEDLELLVLPALSILAEGVDVVRESRLASMSPMLSESRVGDLVPIVLSHDSVLKFPRLKEMKADEGV